MFLSNNQDLRSVQAREAMNDGKAPKEDPDAEFEFRDDYKRVLLEAMGARMFALENHETVWDQIYSEEGFRPAHGQNYLAELVNKTWNWHWT